MSATGLIATLVVIVGVTLLIPFIRWYARYSAAEQQAFLDSSCIRCGKFYSPEAGRPSPLPGQYVTVVLPNDCLALLPKPSRLRVDREFVTVVGDVAPPPYCRCQPDREAADMIA